MQFHVGDRTIESKNTGRYGNVAYFTCELGSSELTETISADLFYDGSNHHVLDYSVYEYLMKVLDNNENQADYGQLKELINSLLNYAAYSQIYFDKNTDNISIDDFGAGYSSLPLMTSIPMDTIKIDKSFIDGIGTGGFTAVFLGVR